jgi:hypothetical protein
MSQPRGGRVQQTRGVKLTREAIIRSRSHRRNADLPDACRQRRCRQLDVVIHLQETQMGGRRAYEDQPNA